jgi:hypothetical protein
MSALVRAELVKLRSTRSQPWLLLATLAMVVLTAAFTVPSAGAQNNPLSLDQPTLLARIVGVSFGFPQLTMVILGVLAFTQEVRYGTVTSTFLVEPRRTRVLAAKGVGLVFVSVVITTATLVVSVIVSAALIHSRHGDATPGPEFWQMSAAAFSVMALSGVTGVAIGAIVRNQIVGVIAVLVWMNAVEHVLLDALPAVGRWTPGGATYGLLQLGPAITTSDTLLDVPIAGLLLVGYTAAIMLLAVAVAPRRDVL